MLELLALRAGRVVSEAELIDRLWADAAPATATKTLHTLIFRLRRRLPRLRIDRVDGGYRLNVELDGVDVHRFERLAVSGRAAGAAGDHERARCLLSEALALWRGNPLRDLDDGASAAQVVRLEQLLFDVEDNLMAARLALGHDDVLVAELEAAVAAQPLRERRWCQLMTVLYRCGRRAEALRTFQRARQTLGETTGLEPGPELVALERAVIADDPRLTVTSSKPRAARRTVTLPVWVTSLIGRDEQQARLADQLATSRIVTLTGVGGVGKTRLAVSAAELLTERGEDQVHFVDLSGVRDPAAVEDAVATMLEIPREPDRTVFEQMSAWLSADKSLIVLDNCEQVVDGVALLVRQLTDRIPALRVLATSREPLAVTGEVIDRVDPLPVPPLEAADVAEIADSPAVRLFTQRAHDVDPSFTLTEHAASDVAAICRRLDGIPLAIELAAAHVDVLAPAQIRQRLTNGSSILRNRRRDHSERHASLDTVLESTYRLLDPTSQRLLNRLAVFRNPTTLETVETVITDDLLPVDAVLDALSRLVRRSLIVTTSDGHARRYRLLETVRSFAWQHLVDSGELDTWLARHRDWILAVLQRGAAGWARDVAFWHQSIDEILDDIEQALGWAARTPDHAEQALRSVVGIFSYWGTRRAVGARWCRTLADAATTLAPARRLEALWNACFLMGGVDLTAAESIAEEARRLAAQVPDDPTADALATLATMSCAVFRGDPNLIHHDYEHTAAHLDGFNRLFVDYFEMWATSLDDDHETAHHTMGQLLDRVRARDDPHMYSGFLSEAVDLALMATADHDELRRHAHDALVLARQVPCPLCESKALTSLVLVSLRMAPDGAITQARLAVRRAHDSGLPFAVIAAMPGLEAALHAHGTTREAVHLAAATEALRRRTGHCHLLPARRHVHQRTISGARDALGSDGFEEAWAQGAALTYQQLINASTAPATSAPR